MAARDAYLFYEAAQAVAAAHLGLKIRQISGNPAAGPSDIVFPRGEPKARMILWLTGMAAEKKAVGRSDPLRRTRNRARMKSQVELAAESLEGTREQRLTEARNLLNQAQDRANAICSELYPAIEQVAARLRMADVVSGEEVVEIVRGCKQKRSQAGKATMEAGTALVAGAVASSAPEQAEAPEPREGSASM